ncbi:MAG: D-alanyl-D-alanine carboxypeptidase family protein [Sporomusaceae bacterium]|nr:D-alanyl-D-alanine carboxypeptidase family protein [Sporomusaceae bacterium]
MKIRILMLLCCCLLLLSTAQAADPRIKADAAILMDMKTGQILWNNNMHRRLAPASTTKILTAIIAIEQGQLDADVVVSPRAAATRGSSMYLYSGQVLSLRELLEGLMLRSGNDAAVAIAEHIDGSTEEFARRMNAKAVAIGAKGSNFINPNGLSAVGHYSSAHDLAVIARYALSNPVFAGIVRTRETNIDWLDRKGKEQEKAIRNTNKLLWMFADADGVKTGTTNEAGPCLVASATRQGQKLISVVLHDHERWSDSMRLLQFGFQNFELIDYGSQGQAVATLPVDGGLTPAVSVSLAANAAVVVKAGDAAATSVEVELPELLKAPVFPGQKVGEVIFYNQDKAIKVVDIVADSEVEEKTVSRLIMNQLTRFYRRLANWGVL